MDKYITDEDREIIEEMAKKLSIDENRDYHEHHAANFNESMWHNEISFKTIHYMKRAAELKKMEYFKDNIFKLCDALVNVRGYEFEDEYALILIRAVIKCEIITAYIEISQHLCHTRQGQAELSEAIKTKNGKLIELVFNKIQ
jgi:hypothetical protein